MPFLGIPPSDIDLERSFDGVRVSCTYSSAGVSTSILVRDGPESIIIDAGDGALRDLIEKARTEIPPSFDERAKEAMGTFVEGIRALLLTHDHFDHVGGLLSLLRFLDMVGRRSPLKVLFPEGSETVLGLIGIFEAGQNRFAVEPVTLKGEGGIDIGGWGIEWIPGDHAEVTIDGKVGRTVPSMAYLLTRREIRVLFTGDTCFDQRIAEAAKGCDLAIAEATYPKGEGLPAHMSVEEALRTVSGAKEGWLVHMTGASFEVVGRNSPRK